MASPKIGDKVKYTHKHKSGTGTVVKIWRKGRYVGWNVLDDETQRVIVGVPSYGLEMDGQAIPRFKPEPKPIKPLEMPSVGQISKALTFLRGLERR